MTRRFLEFFAGGGMARAALQPAGWRCVFANDHDFKKAAAYGLNWGRDGICKELLVDDVRNVRPEDLPDAELAWASFPCQDLSLAGGGAGLKGERSGTFYPFWNIVETLVASGRGPQIVALENVTGALTSHRGADFTAICRAFTDAGYQYGAVVLDAALFVPQSRPRLFVIGVRSDVPIDPALVTSIPIAPFHTRSLQHSVARLTGRARSRWIWWRVPTPSPRTKSFADVIEEHPTSVAWHTRSETAAMLAMMSTVNTAKVVAAKREKRRIVGGVYKRTRRDDDGTKVQRAEIRFDDVAGCLRTPAGGSSRQVIVVVDGDEVRSRLISSRETARLMGLPDTYRIPERYNEAYHLTGDGVVVPVVRHLSTHLFERIVKQGQPATSVAVV